MARSTPAPPVAKGSSPAYKPPSSPPITSTVLLARWRLRNTWGMLLITGLGIVAAVMLVCAVPLYSLVATTAGLRGIFTATPTSSTITIHTTMAGISPSLLQEIKKRFEPLPQSTLSPYLTGAPEFSIQSQGFPILSPKPTGNPSDSLSLLGYSMQEASAHAHLVTGRLPNTQSSDLEGAVTPETANQLHLHVGSIIILHFSAYTTKPGDDTTQYIIDEKFPLHIVGIYTSNVANDAFWHSAPLDPTVLQKSISLLGYSAIVSNDTLLASAQKTISQATNLPTSGIVLSSLITELYWYYNLNTSHLTIDNLGDLAGRLSTLQSRIADNYGQIQSHPDYPYIQTAIVSGDMLSTYEGPGTLDRFRNRVSVAQIPVTILMIEVVALVLFFVSMMAELLIERQADAIAVLRSRGASRRQIFGSFVTQSLGLGLIAFIIGPPLALLAVYLLIQSALGVDGQVALNTITSDPAGTVLLLVGYAAIAVLIAVVAMSLATYRAVGFDVLAIRRESARATIRPLWQRLNVDIIAAIIALTGYGISLYLQRLQGLDAQTRVLVQSPLSLITPVFLLLAGILILLRIFPLLLRLGALLATRGRGASAVLALGQMSRAPRQSVRMALLLALASAFAIFSLIFTASQSQRILDVAAYQVGADFSGTIPDANNVKLIAQDTAALKHIRGVTSVTLGNTSTATAGVEEPYPVEIRAVDADTFAQTATWNDTSTSLSTLMQQLVAQRTQADQQDVVPAIVDTLTWNRLGLSQGMRFTLQAGPSSGPNNGNMNFIALAEVQHIPTVNDSTEPGDSNGSPLPGGVLIDYKTYGLAYLKDMGQFLPVNHIWLRTSDDPALVTNVRNALTRNQPQVNPLLDRRALSESLSKDPLYLDLIGELALGASTALLLALIGNLLASWLSARNRLTNFAVLRALGTTPRQVASVLTWEQGITYVTAIVLGVVFGALLAQTVIPTLVFTSVPNNGPTSGTTNGEFYALQHILPVQIVIPLSLVLAVVVLVVICIVTLGMMIRVVTQPSLSQALRLNED